MRVYLLVLLTAAAVTFLATPLVRRVALATRALTPVRARDVHTVPTPRLGGVAMLVGLAAALLVGSQVPFLHEVFFETSTMWAILGGATLVCLLGVADDVWDLDWMTKLVGQVLAAGLMAWQGVQLITFPIFGLTIGSSRLSLFATILVVVVAINAVNFVDGLDGLAAGMIAIGAGAFFVYTYLLTRDASPGNYANLATAVIAAVVGVCVGFLPHNFHPAKIFMGDSGAMLLGLTVAAAAIVVTGQIDPATVSSSQVLPAYVPILLPVAVLLVPLLDMTLAVLRRVRAGHSPFHPDRMHLHHRLLDLGHSHRRAVLIMYMWAAVVSFSAVALAVYSPRQVIIGTVAAVAVAVAVTVTQLPGLRDRRSRRSGDDVAVPAAPVPTAAPPAGSAPAADAPAPAVPTPGVPVAPAPTAQAAVPSLATSGPPSPRPLWRRTTSAATPTTAATTTPSGTDRRTEEEPRG
ncbi:undecaprenyl/decaprenyl-phosphate alpha-N-acetylglucosaminyl 1-phosphate transferase [Georgenia sp. EYE_87]|uniref:MraY family glycosyltransferase n=1 Tax=Georgenia sp. EYE_87 TaxID=2853448 RepID=UPI0027E2A755|nr:MraY family glycosyltransferase [Georgenia sp. EYE_87]MCK6212653.1 undecaprenyl/decaprenyl-phosphate alpha-N-acetylglucosaminyl 1-phosphate transferase [Georgenia sp. EYE_87]